MLKVGVLPVRAEGVPECARRSYENVISTYPESDAAAQAQHAHREAERRGPVSRLKVTETFVSIQGEADAVGWPTLFIRLTGCPLRCVYCDTQYSFYGGEWQTLDELLEVARGSGVRHVCVTGGEPLAQKDCLALLDGAVRRGLRGVARDQWRARRRPASMRASAVSSTSRRRVPAKRTQQAREPRRADGARPGASSCSARARTTSGRCDAAAQHAPTPLRVPGAVLAGRGASSSRALLAEWILADRLDVRLQVQLHKYLWGNEPGR